MSDFEFLVSTVGTSGDALPFIGLTKELVRRGHRATVLTNADHAKLAEQHGVEFAAISEPDWPQIGRNEREFINAVWVPGYYKAHTEIQKKVQSGRKLFLVNRTGNWGSLFCAERYSIPFVNVALQPCSIRQTGHPIVPLSLIQVNDYRHSIGLGEADASNGIVEPSLATISLFPDWFGEPQSTWDAAGTCVGFPFLNEDSGIPDDIHQLIENYGPPVVFSPGTGVQNIDQLLQVAQDFSTRRASPTIFLSKYVSPADIPETPLFKVFSHVSHAALLPRSRLLVHNGGVGACAQAMRAGVPHIVLPFAYDQPDNADRIERLGLGRSLRLSDLHLDGILELFDAITDDAQIGFRLEKAKNALSSQNGIARAIDIVESIALTGSTPRAKETAF